LFPDLSRLDNSGSAAVRDAGSTDATGGPTSIREIACEANAGCPTPSNFCCNTVGGLSCQSRQGFSDPGWCELQGAGIPGKGKAFLCDGAEDCEPGEQCCFSDVAEGDGVNARCKSQCSAAEKVVCNATTQQCPNGTSCNGTVAAGDFRICQ
jgi:hypothetical protein